MVPRQGRQLLSHSCPKPRLPGHRGSRRHCSCDWPHRSAGPSKGVSTSPRPSLSVLPPALLMVRAWLTDRNKGSGQRGQLSLIILSLHSKQLIFILITGLPELLINSAQTRLCLEKFPERPAFLFPRVPFYSLHSLGCIAQGTVTTLSNAHLDMVTMGQQGA